MSTRTFAAAAALVLTVVAGGCDRQGAAWEEARQADTVAAYEAYLAEFGDSPQAGEARQRLGALQAAALWDEATQADSAEAYQRYVEQFPDGAQAGEARNRLAALERQREWAVLAGSTDVEALRAFAARHQEHPVAAEANARVAELEAAAREQARLAEERRRAEEAKRTHRVQLAAFRDPADAERGLARLTERLAETLGATDLEIGTSGSFHLLRTEPLERPDANALCARLKERGQDCLVVGR